MKSIKVNQYLATVLLSVASLNATSEEAASAWEANRNHEWEARCFADHQPRPEAEYYLIETMLKSACGQRLYGDTPNKQHLGTCMLARLTLAVTEQDAAESIHYCKTTNGWH